MNDAEREAREIMSQWQAEADYLDVSDPVIVTSLIMSLESRIAAALTRQFEAGEMAEAAKHADCCVDREEIARLRERDEAWRVTLEDPVPANSQIYVDCMTRRGFRPRGR